MEIAQKGPQHSRATRQHTLAGRITNKLDPSRSFYEVTALKGSCALGGVTSPENLRYRLP